MDELSSYSESEPPGEDITAVSVHSSDNESYESCVVNDDDSIVHDSHCSQKTDGSLVSTHSSDNIPSLTKEEIELDVYLVNQQQIEVDKSMKLAQHVKSPQNFNELFSNQKKKIDIECDNIINENIDIISVDSDEEDKLLTQFVENDVENCPQYLNDVETEKKINKLRKKDKLKFKNKSARTQFSVQGSQDSNIDDNNNISNNNNVNMNNNTINISINNNHINNNNISVNSDNDVVGNDNNNNNINMLYNENYDIMVSYEFENITEYKHIDQKTAHRELS